MGIHGRVLVCGAGPTGLVAAISLIRSGIDVQLIDAASEPSPLSKAAVIWRRTLEGAEAIEAQERHVLHLSAAGPVAGVHNPAKILLARLPKRWRNEMHKDDFVIAL